MSFRPRLPRSGSFTRWTTGMAWFFVLFSLAHLAWVVGIKVGNPAGLTTLYQTSVATTTGEEVHRAWGLAYDGGPGLLLALGQAILVATAAGLTLLSSGRLRNAGHGILIGWATLWAADLIHLAGLTPDPVSIGQAGFMTLLFGCTVARALRPRRVAAPADTAAGAFVNVPANDDPPAPPAAEDEPAPDRAPHVRRVMCGVAAAWPRVRDGAKRCGCGMCAGAQRARGSVRAARQAWSSDG